MTYFSQDTESENNINEENYHSAISIKEQAKQNTLARKRIEELLEKKRLKELLDDEEDWEIE